MILIAIYGDIYEVNNFEKIHPVKNKRYLFKIL